MKKLLFALLITTALFSPALASEESVDGYAAFFYLHDPTEEPVVYDDFSYYLNSVNPWLTEKNIIVSYHTKTPFTLSLVSGQEFEFPSKDLELDLGVVFVRPDGQSKVVCGVQTDVDIMNVANDFFYKQAL